MARFQELYRRSIEQVENLATDAQRFDRQEIARIADVWDNSTGPLFALAGMRPSWRRDRKARQALRWMADMGPRRRAWMIDTSGPGMADLLGPPGPEPRFHRDYQGRIRGYGIPVAAAGLATDYRLEAATVTGLRVERTGRGLDGRLDLCVHRRYGEGEATVTLNLGRMVYAHFDSRDDPGVQLKPGAVLLGSGGLLRAATITADLYDDPQWHLSSAGRAADLIVPRQPPRRVPKPRIPIPRDPAASEACLVWQSIRRIRYPGLVGRVPVPQLCEFLDGRRTEIPPDGPAIADRMPDDGELTLAAWSAEKVIVNYLDQDRPAAARFAGPVVISADWRPGSPRSLAVRAG